LKNSTIINNEAEKLAFVEKMAIATIDKPILIETSLYKKDRSLAQNRLFHMWMNEVSAHYYETQGIKSPPRAWKVYFKQLFLGEDVHVINKKQVVAVRGTSSLNVLQFTEFLNDIDIYCADPENEINCQLTHPSIYDEAMVK